jgi:hypothetical protein
MKIFYAIDRSKGFVSLALWSLFQLSMLLPDRQHISLLVCFILGWLVAVPLAGAGLCGGSRANKLAALVTIGWSLYYVIVVPRIRG